MNCNDRRETARRQREEEEAKQREELLRTEARRSERISEIETAWARLQEVQRQQDDALIAFITVARQRREYEREQVRHAKTSSQHTIYNLIVIILIQSSTVVRSMLA